MSAKSICDKIDKYIAVLQGDELTQKVAECGKEAADRAYASSRNRVSVQKTKDGHTLSAGGRGIMFLEFGAGTQTDTGSPLAKPNILGFAVVPGSWSRVHAQQFSRLGVWQFRGHLYRFITPRRGMYHGLVAMKSNVGRIFKELTK